MDKNEFKKKYGFSASAFLKADYDLKLALINNRESVWNAFLPTILLVLAALVMNIL
jgi:hypothetical protein